MIAFLLHSQNATRMEHLPKRDQGTDIDDDYPWPVVGDAMIGQKKILIGIPSAALPRP